MRCIIAGTRDLHITMADVVAAVAASRFQISTVVSGHSGSVDRLGEEWAAPGARSSRNISSVVGSLWQGSRTNEKRTDGKESGGSHSFVGWAEQRQSLDAADGARVSFADL